MCGFCLFVVVFSVLFEYFNNKTCISDFKLLPVCFRHCVHEMFSRILPKELEWKHSIMNYLRAHVHTFLCFVFFSTGWGKIVTHY